MFKKWFLWFRSKGGIPPAAKQTASPEELCEIDPETMSKEQIRKKLAKLYMRHNNAVSSLNPERRAEAKIMLDVIVDCRERYIDSKP
jgi:hypothetical protein